MSYVSPMHFLCSLHVHSLLVFCICDAFPMLLLCISVVFHWYSKGHAYAFTNFYYCSKKFPKLCIVLIDWFPKRYLSNFDWCVLAFLKAPLRFSLILILRRSLTILNVSWRLYQDNFFTKCNARCADQYGADLARQIGNPLQWRWNGKRILFESLESECAVWIVYKRCSVETHMAAVR